MLGKRNMETLLWQRAAEISNIGGMDHMRTVQELDIRDFTEEMELYSGIISETKEQFKVVFQSQRDVPFVMVGTIWRDRGTMAVTKETSPKEINHLTSGYRDG